MQKITFQGAPGAYSHIACKELFPGADYIASDTFEQAMELVDNGEADFAVIPVPAPPPTIGLPSATWARKRSRIWVRVSMVLLLE